VELTKNSSPGEQSVPRGCLVLDSDPGALVLPEGLVHRGLRRVVIKPNMGYLRSHPGTVRPELLARLMTLIGEGAPQCTIHVIEGVTFAGSALDGFAYHGLLDRDWPVPVVFGDTDLLPRCEYLNPRPLRPRFGRFTAPELLGQADLALSVAPLKRTILNGTPLLSGTVKNLYGLLPRDMYRARSPHSRGMLHRPSVHMVIPEVFRTLGRYFHGGIVDLHEFYDSPDWHPDRGRGRSVGKVIVGTNLVETDLKACEVAGVEPNGYLVDLKAENQRNS
jgi:uncharacterized protein (DUF362 family)